MPDFEVEDFQTPFLDQETDDVEKMVESMIEPVEQFNTIEADTPITLQQPHPNAQGPYVQYNGIATLRIMDKNAWHSAGVKSDKVVQWNSLNGKRVPKSFFTEDELNYLLNVDGRFSEVDD